MRNRVTLTEPDELAHYGVLGMKWGVRRYQPYPSGYSGSGKFLGKLTKPKPERTPEEKAALKKKRIMNAAVFTIASIPAAKNMRKVFQYGGTKKQSRSDELLREYGKLEDQMTYGKKTNVAKNAQLEKKMAAIEKELFAEISPGAKNKRNAARISEMTKLETDLKALNDSLIKERTNELWTRYGKLEDQLTYGKKENKRKNAKLMSELAEIEAELKVLAPSEVKKKKKQLTSRIGKLEDEMEYKW